MSRTALFLNSSGSIDMYDDVSTPLNFNIADIRNPEKRNSNYSKTIKIPGTANNNLLLGNIFDINITNGIYNPNSKGKCSLLIDDQEQMNGYMQLLNIIIKDNSEVEYEISILGNVGNPFNALGNSELTALDFSVYNHTYDYATQVASWTNGYGQGYCYPLIDYGFDNGVNDFKVEHLFPAMFLRTYIDKILASIGYTYTSTFFESAFFKQLIIPANFSALILTDAQILLRLFNATQTSVIIKTITANDNVPAFDVIYNNEVSDVSGLYDNTTGIFTVTSKGYYSFTADGSLVYSMTPVTAPYDWADEIFIKKSTDGGATYSIMASTYNTRTANGTYTTYVSVTNVLLNVGDKIKVQIRYDASVIGTGTIRINSGTFKNAVVNSGLLEGDTLYVNTTIPIKIKQKDLLLSVIRMFNLYVDIDKNNDKNLLIETRDTFYAAGTRLDWTYKLDNSKNVEFRPMGELDYKEFIYNYTDDGDYYNKKYKDTYQETYGNYRYITDNDFLTNVNETKIIFSPTPLVGDNANNRVIPRIWDVDSSNNNHAKGFNIRILYNGGVTASNVGYTITSAVTGLHPQVTYLYAGHLDQTANPTLDLCFGVPREVYYNATAYTDNNLFNAYHKKFVDEITDRDSKIVTAYFYLRPEDIRNLDFRNEFYFENQYFRLNKIYDYDPLRHEVTKCEFIKIKDAGNFASTNHPVYGGYHGDVGEGFPIFAGGITPNNNVLKSSSAALLGGKNNTLNDNLKELILLGENNVIGDSKFVSIVGSSGNIVGSGCENINLINSSGCTISSGLKNVTIINSAGLNVTESSGTYIDSFFVKPSVFHKHYIQVSDSTTQTVATANSGQAITFNTDEFNLGFTHSTVTNTSRIYITETAAYMIGFEAQVASSSANKEAYFWFRVDGVDIPRTTTALQLVNNNDQKSVTLVYIYTFLAGQYFEIIMGGSSTSVSIVASATIIAPTRPTMPSGILTATML